MATLIEPTTPVETVTVALGERAYPIWIGDGILPSLGARLRAIGLSGTLALVSVPPVFDLYGETARARPRLDDRRDRPAAGPPRRRRPA